MIGLTLTELLGQPIMKVNHLKGGSAIPSELLNKSAACDSWDLETRLSIHNSMPFICLLIYLSVSLNFTRYNNRKGIVKFILYVLI